MEFTDKSMMALAFSLAYLIGIITVIGIGFSSVRRKK